MYNYFYCKQLLLKKYQKLINIMRLSILLSIVFAWNVSANVFSQIVHFEKTDQEISIKDVLKAIENQTEYTFFYNDAFLDLNRSVKVNRQEIEVGALLNDILKDTELTYREQSDKFIVITPKSLMQGIIITGTVTDENGEPLPGVTVSIKGASQGTVTNANGAYSLSVLDTDAILVFSFVGYATQEMIVGSQRAIDVMLGEAARELEEVVVIGYGTAKRRDLTGATGRINAADIKNKPSNNVMDFLRGTVAGFNSNMATSAKGGGSMEIRGQTSIKALNDPLIVLDGVIYNGELADINPADIESIDVLKDGSSAAVYGTRAAAGVLAITTKRGVSEKPVIDVNASWGISTLTKLQPVYSPQGYITMRGDAMRSNANFSHPEWYYRDPYFAPPGVTDEQYLDGQTLDLMTVYLQHRLNFGPTEQRNYYAGKTIDWMDAIFRNGLRQDYNVGVGGKSKMVNYYFSLGYLNNQGIVVGDKYENIRSRLNLSIDVTDWLQVGTNLQFANRDQGTNPVSVSQGVGGSPYGSIYEEDGNHMKQTTNDDNVGTNPFIVNDNEKMDRRDNLTANLFAKIKLPLGIKYQMTFNQWFNFRKTYTFYPSKAYLDGNKNEVLTQSNADRTEGSGRSWQVDNIFSWDKTIANIHRFDVTFLVNAEKSQTWLLTARAFEFEPSDGLGFHGMGMGDPSKLFISENNDTYSTGNAMMGRINYILMDRYLLTASYRRDGFSAFGKNHPYAYFPAVAAAWILSEESFMKKATWLNYAKLRLSYGINGNRDIGIYSALAQVGYGKVIIDGEPAIRIFSNTLPNYDLRWEKTTAYNAGFEFSIFNSVLSGSIDGYMMSTKDLLMEKRLPPVTAYDLVMTNLGEITNKGMEVTLNSTNIKTENLNWRSTLIFSFNRNQLKHLDDGAKQNVLDDKGNVIGQREADNDQNHWYIGHALDQIYDYKLIGVWQEDESEEAKKYGLVPGDMKLQDFKNYEGRSEYVRSDEDRVFQGYTKPRYRLGLRNDVTFLKNFNLSVFMRADLGHYSTNNYYIDGGDFPHRINTYKLEYWTPENPINTAGRLRSGFSPRFNYYVKSSYFRVQDVSLSYTLPANILSAVHLQSARVFLNMNNLLTITSKRIFWDPETYGPTPRIFSFGINVTL